MALLGLYLLFTAQRGVVLIASGNIPGILLGAGLLLLPAVGAWALVREVIFGARIQRMAQELDAQGKLPEDTLPRSPSGRVDCEAASVELEKFADVLEANPDSWEAWFNLLCMYDVCGERKRARATPWPCAKRACGASASALSNAPCPACLPRSWLACCKLRTSWTAFARACQPLVG